jgi:hypothetical protein
MRKLALGVLLAGTLVAGGAQAQNSLGLFLTQQLYEECQMADSTPEKRHCAGLIEGMSDMMMYNALLLTQMILSKSDAHDLLSLIAICPTPASPSHGTEIQAFVNWARDHPERRHEFYVNGVIDAMRASWPCTGY